MSEQELRKEYDFKWKEEHPLQYGIWLICFISGFALIFLILFQLVGGLNRQKVEVILICLGLLLALECAAGLLMFLRWRGWPKYREENKDRLK